MTACGTHVPPRFHASELPANQILHLTKEHCGPCAAYITKNSCKCIGEGGAYCCEGWGFMRDWRVYINRLREELGLLPASPAKDIANVARHRPSRALLCAYFGGVLNAASSVH